MTRLPGVFCATLLFCALCACGATDDTPLDKAVELRPAGKADQMGMQAELPYPYNVPARFFFNCEEAAGCDMRIRSCVAAETMELLARIHTDAKALVTLTRKSDGKATRLQVDPRKDINQSCKVMDLQNQKPGRYDLTVQLSSAENPFKVVANATAVVSLDVELRPPHEQLSSRHYQVMLVSGTMNRFVEKLLDEKFYPYVTEGSVIAGLDAETDSGITDNDASILWGKSLGILDTTQLVGQSVKLTIKNSSGLFWVKDEIIGSCEATITAEAFDYPYFNLFGKTHCSGDVNLVMIAFDPITGPVHCWADEDCHSGRCDIEAGNCER